MDAQKLRIRPDPLLAAGVVLLHLFAALSLLPLLNGWWMEAASIVLIVSAVVYVWQLDLRYRSGNFLLVLGDDDALVRRNGCVCARVNTEAVVFIGAAVLLPLTSLPEQSRARRPHTFLSRLMRDVLWLRPGLVGAEEMSALRARLLLGQSGASGDKIVSLPWGRTSG